MSRSARVELLRSNNWFVVAPTPAKVRGALMEMLTFTTTVHLYGYEAMLRRKADLSTVETQEWQCYQVDVEDRLVTSIGFLPRVRKVLTDGGYEVAVKWASPEEAEAYQQRKDTVYKPRWDRIDELVAEGFEFRQGQREAVELVTKFERGAISCPPGWGKGTWIMLVATLFPRAKIDVVTKSVQVMTQRLYPELAGSLPAVGMIGGGRKITGQRVMCITAGSLHHGRFSEADFVLVDECQDAGAPKFAEQLANYEHARIWGLSATVRHRQDKLDYRFEALAGPVRLHVSYAEAEDAGMVTPIEILWRRVRMDINPCSDIDDKVDRKRAGIWANDHRNRLIAKDARRYGDDVQVLITVETIEHALHLKKLLPEYTLVYAPQSNALKNERDLRRYRKQELVDDDFEYLTREELQQHTEDFTSGKLKKAIVTTVWNVGVSFDHLQVLIRADAGSSAVTDTQIPGRTSRLAKGKEKSIVHDYKDVFDPGFERRSATRRANYAENGWTQNEIDKTRSLV